MKIIRALAGLLLVVGVVFPVLYNIFILPPIEKQQHILESMITELKLDEGNGIYFKEVNRTKLNFHYVYVYNKTMYNKLEIKNLLFQKLHDNGWKSRSTGASRSINYISEMEKNNYICEAHIYDEHFDIRLKYKELYE